MFYRCFVISQENDTEEILNFQVMQLIHELYRRSTEQIQYCSLLLRG